jgi:hypothetical protein
MPGMQTGACLQVSLVFALYPLALEPPCTLAIKVSGYFRSAYRSHRIFLKTLLCREPITRLAGVLAFASFVRGVPGAG